MSPTSSTLKKYSQIFPIGMETKPDHYRMTLIARRKRHLQNLDSFALFSAVPREPGSENIWIMSGMKIFQEPSIMYLTGINQPEIILMLNPLGPQKEILFLPQKDSKKQFWDGIRFGLSNNKNEDKKDKEIIDKLTGLRVIKPISEFENYLLKIIQKSKKDFGYIFYHQYATPKKNFKVKDDHNWNFYKKINSKIKSSLGNKKSFQIKSIALKHFSLRLPLDSYQLANVKKAEDLTNKAYKNTLKKLKSFSSENELSNYLEYELQKESTFGLSFPNIIAGGKNATILHYLKNDEKFRKKDLVLMDFGVRYGTMHADISRTLPLSGRYNPLQKLLYEIVLDGMKFNEKNAREGITIRELNFRVWEFIEEQLQTRFFNLGGEAKRDYSFQPHGVSHLMGEQEHDGDPFRIYQDIPLKSGWQISNEPGLYGYFTQKIKGKTYSEFIGIRIEDNLLIQKNGVLNLSIKLARETADIEKMIG